MTQTPWLPPTSHLTSLSMTQLQCWAPIHVKPHLTQDDPVRALGSHLQSHDVDLAQRGRQLSLCQPVLVELADYEEPWGGGLYAAH